MDRQHFRRLSPRSPLSHPSFIRGFDKCSAFASFLAGFLSALPTGTGHQSSFPSPVTTMGMLHSQPGDGRTDGRMPVGRHQKRGDNLVGGIMLCSLNLVCTQCIYEEVGAGGHVRSFHGWAASSHVAASQTLTPFQRCPSVRPN